MKTKTPKMRVVNDENYQKFVYKEDGRIKALKFGATWCHPCHEMDKVMPEIMKATPRIDWFKADLDKDEKIAHDFKIMSVPFVMFFRNGKQIKRCKIDGFGSAEQVIAYLKKKGLTGKK